MGVRLIYFDFAGGRGEDCRMALHVAGVPFEDVRVKGPDWAALKPETPWGALPVLEVDGHAIGQSNAILSYIGRQYGLHPTDPWESARHDAILAAVEDLRTAFTPALREADPEKRLALRTAFADGALQDHARRLARELGAGPFYGGQHLTVADLKVFVGLRWFRSGVLDGVPTSCLDGHRSLVEHAAAVAAHPGVAAWISGVRGA